VLRDGAIEATGGLWRRAGLPVALACVIGVVGAPSGLAQQSTTSNPQELWRAYPLEQKPTTTASPPQRRVVRSDSAASRSSASDPPWILLLGVAAGGAAGILIALAVYRRQASREAVAEPARAVAAEPARGVVAEPPPQRRPPAPEPTWSVAAPTETEPVGPGATRDAPVCQVRWSRRGARFYAVTVEADGTERRIARSPQFQWRGPSPPEQSAEAQAALRELAKELRDKGWRPLRAKGVDFDERQWYARRFRWPTEAENEKAARAREPSRQEANGRAGRAQAPLGRARR
jgi:hypothetical protein